MSVKDINSIFNFTGAIGSSSVMFLFPGLSYILALREYESSDRRRNCETTFYHIMAWIFLALYVLLVTTYIFNFVMDIIDPKVAPAA